MGGQGGGHRGFGGLLLAAVVLLAAACWAGCGRQEPKPAGQGAPGAPAGTIGVGVTIPPQADFVRRVGGNHVRVTILVKPGGNPHTYEPETQQVTELARVDVFFRIGVPFEDTLLKKLEGVNPSMRVVDTGQGIALRTMEVAEIKAEEAGERAEAGGAPPVTEHESQSRSEGNKDPHTWLDPNNVKIMAKNIADTLIQIDPAHADEYRANLAKYQADLDELDAYIRSRCKDLKSHDFIVYHPAFGYFAKAYGLRQIPIEVEGKDPSPQTLAATIDFARAHGIKVIFHEQQFSAKAARAVAEGIGGKVVSVDDLAEDYIPNMRKVADAFVETLK